MSKTLDAIIRWERDDDGVVILTLDEPGRSVTTITPAFMAEWAAIIERLVAERESIRGVILTSGKDSFLGGANLTDVLALTPDTAGDFLAVGDSFRGGLRKLESFGRPVVAALNGSALGGGYELALACHHRIAVRGSRAKFGLPEVTMGLLPGAGIARSVRLLGVVESLSVLLLQGQSYSPEDALARGLVAELVDSPTELVAAAKKWITGNPQARQPWDCPGFRIPGVARADGSREDVLARLPGALRAQVEHGAFQAPCVIFDAAVECAKMDIGPAIQREAEAFASVLLSPQAKNMTRAFFFDARELAKGATRPAEFPRREVRKLAVLGAGMMGAGIAWQAARSGLPVVLKDTSVDKAEAGKDHSRKLAARAVRDGRMSQESADALLGRIATTADTTDLAGCDAVVEAVFEATELKKQVFAETEAHLTADSLLASNTSQIPIRVLAEGVSRPGDFIGLHFFSPVEKMPLVEIVVGEKTSRATLARAVDFVQQLRFTPLVVNDSRGFFTTRVILQFLAEAFQLVLDGIDPATIEEAATLAGYPVGPLQLADELNLKTARKALQDAAGTSMARHPGFQLIDRMLDDFDRAGRLHGRGFYDYDSTGRRVGMWPGLVRVFRKADSEIPMTDIRERMMVMQALDAVACFEEGVLDSHATANIASIRAIGFPAWTGGVVQFVDQYEGGTAGFVARCRQLAETYGERFLPSPGLVALARAGAPFRSDPPAQSPVTGIRSTSIPS